MRRVFYNRFGGPEVLELEQFEPAQPGVGEVRLKVAGCGLNPIDYKTRLGLGFVSQQLRESFHFVPGYDVSGIVESLGEGVDRFWLGKPVFGMVNFPLGAGCYAESLVAPIAELQVTPTELPLADAAALPLASLTAWQALFDVGKLQRDERVLVLAGAGGVGHIATQLAHWKGAYVGATSSLKNHLFLRQCQVNLPIDYQEAANSGKNKSWDLIIDLMGGGIGEAALSLISENGRMVTVPTNTAEYLTAKGTQKGKTVLPMKVAPCGDQLKQIVELINSHKLNVTVSNRYSLDRVKEAQQALEAGHVRGKLILEL